MLSVSEIATILDEQFRLADFELDTRAIARRLVGAAFNSVSSSEMDSLVLLAAIQVVQQHIDSEHEAVLFQGEDGEIAIELLRVDREQSKYGEMIAESQGRFGTHHAIIALAKKLVAEGV